MPRYSSVANQLRRGYKPTVFNVLDLNYGIYKNTLRVGLKTRQPHQRILKIFSGPYSNDFWLPKRLNFGVN